MVRAEGGASSLGLDSGDNDIMVVEHNISYQWVQRMMEYY
jgi:hypothetical protein